MTDEEAPQTGGSEEFYSDDLVPLAGPNAATPQGTPDPLLNSEMGIERVLPFSIWATEGEVARDDTRIKIDDLVEMRRRDGQARALIRLFVLPILSAFADGEWIANDEDGEESMDEEVEFANQMWNLAPVAGGMTTSKTSVLKKFLQGITDGFAVFEEVRHIPEEGPLAGKITLRKLAYRDPRTIRFRVDDMGGFNGIRQVTTFNGKTIDVKIPKEKCVFWTCNAEENPFYGVSMFEAAYEHYTVKRKLYYIAHLAAQFAAVPGRVGTVPKGADPRYVQAFKQSLMNFAFNTAVTAPEGFTVTPFNGNSGFDFIKLIDHHNHMMSKSVLAGFLDSEQRATLIEIGNADPATDFFIMALESIMDEIAETLSSYLMPKYIDWNFGSKRYPVFKFGQLSDSAKGTIKELFLGMVTSSVLNSTPEFVREMEKKLATALDLPIDYDEIEKQETEAAEEEAAKAEEEAAAFMGGGGPPKPGDEFKEPEAPQGTPGKPPPPGIAPGHPKAPGGAPTGPVAPKGPPGSVGPLPPPGFKPKVALSADASIDDLVAMAADLLSERGEEFEDKGDF